MYVITDPLIHAQISVYLCWQRGAPDMQYIVWWKDSKHVPTATANVKETPNIP